MSTISATVFRYGLKASKRMNIMHIKRLKLSNFMLFDTLDIEWSPNINIISGSNSTGKTALIKLMYSTLKVLNDAGKSRGETTKEKFCEDLATKLQGVFRPDDDTIGRLVNRQQGSNRADISLAFYGDAEIAYGFSNRRKKIVDLASHSIPALKALDCVYIPPKEIISAIVNFASLYDDFHIEFEETYYDLARLLDRPLKKGPNTHEQNAILDSFGHILDGNIVLRDKKFYLKVKGSGEFEMGLVAEGYRKLSTIMQLVLTESLGKSSVLFWDEPETNMNPKMIAPITQAVVELAKMGVQVFITTHDYFVQQSFNLLASYADIEKEKLKISFVSLFEDGSINKKIRYEVADTLAELSHNSIMQEFDALYDRELRMINGSD